MNKSRCQLAICLTLLIPLALTADDRVVRSKKGVVVTVSPPATDVGISILKKGGNAVDAAVATAFALAVTFPEAGNIGGGGFMVVHPPKGKPVVVEYRETAPGKATKHMFLKDDDRYGHRVVGVPGTVSGMALAHKRFGKLPWKTLLMPAVRLAGDGIIVDEPLAKSLNGTLTQSKKFKEFQRVFGNNGVKWKAGDRLVQPELAATLLLIADKGPDAFYKGKIADQLIAEMRRGGGLITKKDLANYKAEIRQPIHGRFRGYDVYGPPLPSSGGTCLVEMLNVLSNFKLKEKGRYSAETLHLMIETMRRAYCDRARYLGDTAFVTIPPRLTTEAYGSKLAKSINPDKATRSIDLAKEKGIKIAKESESTTHFSIIDKDGMAVSNTYTLERGYGSRVVVKGAGFLLNNEMLDFNWRPGYTSRKGAIGTAANLIEAGKKMLSSQTPTIVAKNGKVFLVTGSPGGRTIINTVLCVVLNVTEFEMDLVDAVKAPRLHHSWFPDQASAEDLMAYKDAVKKLRSMGHRIVQRRQGDAHSIVVDPKDGTYVGVADNRRNGKAAGLP